MRWGPVAPATPRLARSLRVLARQVDASWPLRSRITDGWIGDPAHAARVSDHNPDERGIVHALDLTAAGIRPWPVVIAALLHPSTHYVIWDGLIWSSITGHQPLRYTGPDPHRTHVHVSIKHGRNAEQSARSWLEWPSG